MFGIWFASFSSDGRLGEEAFGTVCESCSSCARSCSDSRQSCRLTGMAARGGVSTGRELTRVRFKRLLGVDIASLLNTPVADPHLSHSMYCAIRPVKLY